MPHRIFLGRFNLDAPLLTQLRSTKLSLAVLFLAILCLCSTALSAQSSTVDRALGSIKGQLTPAHDHDLVLATARIPDLALKVKIDADGAFRFSDVKPGSYLIEVRVPSVGVTAERVEVRPGEVAMVDIDLKPGSHFDEIVVTASSDARGALDLATPTTSLGGDELSLRLQSSLGETLSQEAGISSSFFGPGASRPIIRGLSGDRVRMLEGGVGTGDASGVSADHAVTADPGQAERIEVLRGPATLLYGSSAVGGVVNVIDERIPSHRATGGVNGDVTLRGSSVDDGRSAAINLNGGGGSWAWHVDAITRETDDYEVPGFAQLDDDDEHGEEHDEDGEEHDEDGDEHEEENPFGSVPNTDTESQGARVGVTYFGDRGFLGISVSGLDNEYGLPGGLGHGEHGEEHEEEEHEEEEHEEEEHEEEEEEIVRIDMRQRRVDLRGEITQPFGAFQGLKLRIGSTDYEHTEFEGDEAGTLFFNDSLEGRLELVQQQRNLGSQMTHSGSFGVQYFDRDFEAIGAEAFLPRTLTERWAIFTLQEIDTGPLRWQLGARFESQDAKPESDTVSARSHDGLSASIGLVWKANDTFSIGASASRSIKLPAPEELYSNGLHVATQSFEIGDESLGEEVGLGLDLSLRWQTDVFSGELTFFRQDFDDFIFQAFTGGEEEGFPIVLYSQEDAELSGIELQGRIEILDRNGHHLHLRLVGDVVDAELDAGGNLPRIPPLRLGGGLHYHSEHWNASAEVQWVDDQTDVAANETTTESYTLLNAHLGYRFLFKNQILDVLLRGRNLGDEEARSHTSFLKNVAPLPGRDVSLALKFLF